MNLKRKAHLKKSKSFALSQARRSARIRCLKQAKQRIADRHALFFLAQQEDS